MEILPYKHGRLVINSLLCYVENKRKSLDRDHLSRLIRDHFNDDEIRDALRLLIDLRSAGNNNDVVARHMCEIDGPRCVNVDDSPPCIGGSDHGQRVGTDADVRRIDNDVETRCISSSVDGRSCRGPLINSVQCISGTYDGQRVDSDVDVRRISDDVEARCVSSGMDGQRMGSSCRGPLIDSVQCISGTYDGQCVGNDINSPGGGNSVDGRLVDTCDSGQCIGHSHNGQCVGSGIDGQHVGRNIDGQCIGSSVDGRLIDSCDSRPCIGGSYDGQCVSSSDSEQHMANIDSQQCINSNFDDALDAIFDILDSDKHSRVWFAALDIARFPETNTELLLRILDQLTWIKSAVEQCSPSTPLLENAAAAAAASEASLSPPSVTTHGSGKNKRSLETAVAKLKEMRSTTSKNVSPSHAAPTDRDFASMTVDCPAAKADDQMSVVDDQSPLSNDHRTFDNRNCIRSQTPMVLALRPELPLSNGQAIYRPLFSTTNFMNSLLFNSQATTLRNDEKLEEDNDQTAENAFKPYVCQHRNCNKRFTNKFLLKKHEFIHTGLRPHQCNICFKK
uniref:C2H2-type domain-containing protein n=1 Tax=Romanomermis culicivorax TaxID=13658 RepID=A0A915JEK8_ROMCU